MESNFINHHYDLTYNASTKHTLVIMIVSSLFANTELGALMLSLLLSLVQGSTMARGGE
jgi:hypothetical protein